MILTDLKALWVIEPNWDSKPKVSHTWVTGIQKSILGIEKRSSYVDNYKLGTTFSFLPYDYTQIAWLHRRLALKQHEVWGMPVFPDLYVTTAQIVATSTSIVFDTSHRHWRDFGILINPTDWTQYEAFTITSVAAGQLNTSAIVSTWPIGTLLFPLFPAKLKAVIGMELITTRLSQLEVVAEETA